MCWSRQRLSNLPSLTPKSVWTLKLLIWHLYFNVTSQQLKPPSYSMILTLTGSFPWHKLMCPLALCLFPTSNLKLFSSGSEKNSLQVCVPKPLLSRWHKAQKGVLRLGKVKSEKGQLLRCWNSLRSGDNCTPLAIRLSTGGLIYKTLQRWCMFQRRVLMITTVSYVWESSIALISRIIWTKNLGYLETTSNTTGPAKCNPVKKNTTDTLKSSKYFTNMT